MSHPIAAKKEVFQSESSIFPNPVSHPKENQLKYPTWALLVILVVSFFILKSFIYISDKKRHGK